MGHRWSRLLAMCLPCVGLGNPENSARESVVLGMVLLRSKRIQNWTYAIAIQIGLWVLATWFFARLMA